MTRKRQRSAESAATTRRKAVRKRERTKQWIVIAIFSGLVATAVGVIVYGAVIAPKTQAVAVVNGEKITVQDFQKRMRLNYYLAVQNAVLTQGLPTELAQQQVDVSQLSQGTLDNMIEERLMQQAADEQGIAVSEGDVDDLIHSYLGFPPLNQPDAVGEPSPTPVRATPTATSTYVYTLTPSPTLEGEAGQATPTVTATPTATPGADEATATPTPTSEAASAEAEAAFQDAYAERLAEWEEASGMSEADIREVFAGLVILDKLREEVISEVADTAEYARFATILVDTEAEAQEILDQLGAGANFAELAAERSLEDTTAYRGGEFGWATRDELLANVPELADFVFSQPLNEPGGPIQTANGYRVVIVYDRAEAPLDTIALYYQQQQAFQTYRTNLRVDAGDGVEIRDSWQRFVPDLP